MASSPSLRLPPAPHELYQRVRNHFPYFNPDKKNPVFFENAGGSQLPLTVIEAVREHMLDHYVQLGAGYELSNRATSTVDAAHDIIKTFLNVGETGEVVLAGSTSVLLASAADAYRRSGVIRSGDEIIVQVTCHEANAGPWVRLAEDVGATVKWWGVNSEPPHTSSFEELENLLTDRTKLVAVTHVSNLLGEILDVRSVVRTVRESPAGAQARIVVDGVAYAPHRAADVSAWGVDWYAFSVYKTWGPHVAALYGSHVAFRELEGFGPNHYWIDGADVPYKFELGGPSHEACAGILGLAQYISAVARESIGLERGAECGFSNAEDPQGVRSSGETSTSGRAEQASKRNGIAPLNSNGPGSNAEEQNAPNGVDLASVAVGKLDVARKRGLLRRSDVETFYRTVVRMEQAPQEKLLKFLLSKPELTVVGPATWQSDVRVPTVSFVHRSRTSADVTRTLHKAGFAMRHGHMYSRRLLESLKYENVDDGVIRLSLLYYNTPEEVDTLIGYMDDI
ncbi:pyridoxal phosphate (PLP)-dependent aspartate aminotransferase superfamily [Klebsormidium nitens]|uniref:Pyridoxal phosphate (PLP)-dependent aspartate aminotransferase superfamily n=1 Tax=Klebsormidium nitens TaxID=105231 RepID=A0A1Y1IBI1_KLENI|nr:pyridoxal phosphate (PLP)-dependent aspartate aminotransferase superfamily [Klebsormidium nitens]|eukprot:GAQ87923.1 pyridoxal phosphate (PLP)-dependent aspartate aminotransferase superfamily [Klebsormidium nitens]